MFAVHDLFVGFVALQALVSGQRFVGDVCTVERTGSPGECKLFADCAPARDELQKHNRFPQPCGGFQGREPIVCCPKSVAGPQRQPGIMTKRKCREYSKYRYENVVPPTLSLDDEEKTTVVQDGCGIKGTTLIIGGEPAGRREFPHMVAIGYEPTPGEIQFLCGGTIVSRDYVLTAGHCLSDYSQGDAKWAKVGVSQLNDTGKHLQIIEVADRIPYPEYRSSSHYHDIGLLKLKTSIRLNSYARPACLYLKEEISVDQVIASGWGHTSWGGVGSNQLLKVTIDHFNHTFCNDSYRNQISRKLSRGIVNDIQLCAGSTGEEKDTCQGDSGGPLQIIHSGDEVKCMYDIVGVTSFGKACSGSPGVYVRVSYYIKWIEDIVWPVRT